MGPWRREAGQFGQGPLAAVLLQGIKARNHANKNQQYQRIDRLADQAVDEAAAEQQQVGGLQPAAHGPG